MTKPTIPDPGDVETVDGIKVTHGDEPAEDTPPETDVEAEHDTDDGPEESKAARLRKRAQEAEAERDTLHAELDAAREQVTAVRRDLVEQVAAGRLTRPDMLWTLGVDPDSFFTAEGRLLDPVTIRRQVEEHARTWGLERNRYVDPLAGTTSGTHGEATWGDVLDPNPHHR